MQINFINGLFSDWTEVITGVTQGSIVGKFLFNIFLNDIFTFILKVNLCNYADDKTVFYCKRLKLDRKKPWHESF